MGGARPKNVVEDSAGLWIAKFPGRGATRTIARSYSDAPRFGLTLEAALAMIDRIKEVIESEWAGEVRRQGGTNPIVPPSLRRWPTRARVRDRRTGALTQ